METDYLKSSPLLPGVLVSRDGEVVVEAASGAELRISIQQRTGARTFRYGRSTYTVARIVATAFMELPDYQPFFVLHREPSKGDHLDNLFFAPRCRVAGSATWREGMDAEELVQPAPYLELELRASPSLPHLEVSENGAFLFDRKRSACYFPTVYADGRRTFTYNERPYSMLTLVAEAFLAPPPVGMRRPSAIYREGKDSCHYRNLEYMERYAPAYMERCKAVGATSKEFLGRMFFAGTKLDYQDIKKIKLAQEYGVPATELAKRYGVSVRLILRIFSKKEHDIFDL